MRLFRYVGFILVCAVSCASSGVDYTYYTIHPELDKLEASDPKDDLSLSKACTPDETSQAKCIGMMEAEFFKMKQELLELRKALQDCQKGPPPKPE